MPFYRIYRLKEAHQQQFRWAPHAGGASEVKRRDYQAGDRIEAPTPYAAWSELRERGTPLRVGDLLEDEAGELRICKYVGLEEARWARPETAPEPQMPGPV